LLSKYSAHTFFTSWKGPHAEPKKVPLAAAFHTSARLLFMMLIAQEEVNLTEVLSFVWLSTMLEVLMKASDQRSIISGT